MKEQALSKLCDILDVPEVKEYLLKIDAKRLVPLMSAAQIRMSVYPHLYKCI